MLVFGTAFQAAAFRLHHGDLKLGVFAKRAFRQSLEREHERVFDGLGHLSNRQAHLQHARRTGCCADVVTASITPVMIPNSCMALLRARSASIVHAYSSPRVIRA